jgi:copper(I)-binding protein
MNTLPSRWIFSLLALGSAAGVLAQDIKVDGVWARRAPMMEGKGGSGNGAAYLKIRNAGKAADALLGARSAASESVEIHESYQDMGMMMMRPVERLDLAPGKTVELKPGGYHLMLLNLKQDLKPGASIPVTLRFRNAGEVPATAVIK